jgi:hypothetical protein
MSANKIDFENPEVKEFFEKFKEWHSKKIDGIKTRDLKRGAGYYLFLDFHGNHLIGKDEDFILNSSSGKRQIYRLIDFKRFSNPPDMIKSSDWEFIGYNEEKPIAKIKDAKEAMLIYGGVFKGLIENNMKFFGGKL